MEELWAPATCGAGEVCRAALGCSLCDGSRRGCDGNVVVRCDERGEVVETLETCDRCVAGECVDPCGALTLEEAGVGCLYYAADLPQYATVEAMGMVDTPADQPFGVAIANPGTVPLDAVIERNIAAPGTVPPTVVEVTRVTVAAGSVEVVPLPQREIDGYVAGSEDPETRSSLLSSLAYRIRTTRPAMVYQFNPLANALSYSNDASLLVPVHALGEVYEVIGWPTTNLAILEPSLPSEPRPFLVVIGTRAGTRVRVRTTVDIMAGDGVEAADAGDALTFELGELDVLSLRTSGSVDRRSDFTGTRVEATAPVVVFSGNECAFVTPSPSSAFARGACDHLEEQLFPRNTHGPEYVVVRSSPAESPPEPDVIRVLAMRDATEVTTSLAEEYYRTFSLNAGEWLDIVTPRDFVLSANLPVIVGQFLVGAATPGPGEEALGDPAFTLVPPLAQFSRSYTFLVPEGYVENHVLLGVPTGETVRIDGAEPTDCVRAPIGVLSATSYDAVRCPITEGSHSIVSDEPFSLVVQGRSAYASYGYAGGLNYAPVRIECNGDEDCFLGQVCVEHVCTDPPF